MMAANAGTGFNPPAGDAGAFVTVDGVRAYLSKAGKALCPNETSTCSLNDRLSVLATTDRRAAARPRSDRAFRGARAGPRTAVRAPPFLPGAITAAGLAMGQISPVNSCIDKGLVQLQNPSGEVQVTPGTAVSITLASCTSGGGNGPPIRPK